MTPLFSDEYMVSFFKNFCDSIKSRMWSSKRGNNSKYELEDFFIIRGSLIEH
ncbi:MAG: hypothetical protein ACFFCM_20455 [Promethearchaeota archaeon]